MKKNGPKLPNLLIVGAAKSGTTSLHFFLKQHPDVFMSPVKEPKFITSQFLPFPFRGVGDRRVEKQVVKNLEDYIGLFKKAGNERILGEGSTDTLYYYERSIPVIKKILGNPKIIIILRNPVDRAFSNYFHLVRDGREFLSFEEALAEEENRIRNNWDYFWHYKALGLYSAQVGAFLNEFPHVKVLLFDQLRSDVTGMMREIFSFLEIDADFKITRPDVPLNVSGVPKNRFFHFLFNSNNLVFRTGRRILANSPLEDRLAKFVARIRRRNLERIKPDEKIRRQLREFYREDILKLEKILGYDLSSWLRDGPENKTQNEKQGFITADLS